VSDVSSGFVPCTLRRVRASLNLKPNRRRTAWRADSLAYWQDLHNWGRLPYTSINEALADNELEAAYRLLPSIDLSRDVLAVQPHRLLAVADKTSGWADLGSPRRVMDILARNNIQPGWLRDLNSLSDVFGLSA